MKYLFGPINSRRLGRSLGIDIIPFKTCSLNCIYCECGQTTNLTAKIAPYVPAGQVIKELKSFLKDKPELDNITFAGSGEPTLNSEIDIIIKFLKKEYPQYNVTLLTNGTLFYLPRVRRAVLDADLIIPSLDAVSDDVFQKIGRCAKGISAGLTIEGLIKLREEYNGKLYLEFFVIEGINDSYDELVLFKDACLRIKPDLVQLNVLDRPGTENWVETAGGSTLNIIKKLLQPLKVEITGNYYTGNTVYAKDAQNPEDIVAGIISRRPSTLEDLKKIPGLNERDIILILKSLQGRKLIEEIESKRGKFYRARHIAKG